MTTFKPTQRIVLRIPHFSYQTLQNALNSNHILNNVISSDEFKEAILFSSPDLYDALIKYLDNTLPDRDKQRTLNSVIKYLERMCTRCTPFATFASILTTEISKCTNISVSDKLKKHFRLDMLYLCFISQKIQQNRDYIHLFKYKLNSSIYKVGSNIRLITYSYQLNNRKYRIIEFSSNKIIAYIIRKITIPMPASQIVDLLASKFHFNNNEATDIIFTLIQNQVLINELDPFITGNDYFNFLLNKCKHSEITEFQELDKINTNLLCLNDGVCLNDEIKLYKLITESITKLGVIPNKKYILQIDTNREVFNSTINQTIVSQITDCLTFLNRITPNYENTLLLDFKRRFIKRYEQEEIPLIEALDPNIGIGYVVTEETVSNPLLKGLILPNRTNSSYITDCPLYRILIKKLSAKAPDDNNIELTESDATAYSPASNNLPPTLAAMFKIIRSNCNDFELLDLHFFGSSAANLITRFGYTDSHIANMINTITNHEELYYKDYIIAEIAHINSSRIGNILSRDNIREFEIEYLTNSTLDSSKTIPINDILISIRNNNILIRSKKLNKYIIPRLTSAHNYMLETTPIYRFLCDLQKQNMKSSVAFTWCGIENQLNMLPRVCYKNIILSPATWTINTKEFLNNIKHETQRINYLSNLRLPRFAELIAGDNKLFIDFESELSLNALISEIKNLQKFRIVEFLGSDSIVTNSKGESFINECIIPLLKNIDSND